jgi:hypothetical protein
LLHKPGDPMTTSTAVAFKNFAQKYKWNGIVDEELIYDIEYHDPRAFVPKNLIRTIVKAIEDRKDWIYNARGFEDRNIQAQLMDNKFLDSIEESSESQQKLLEIAVKLIKLLCCNYLYDENLEDFVESKIQRFDFGYSHNLPLLNFRIQVGRELYVDVRESGFNVVQDDDSCMIPERVSLLNDFNDFTTVVEGLRDQISDDLYWVLN